MASSQYSGTVTIDAGAPVPLNTIRMPATRIILQATPAAGSGLIYVFVNVPVGKTPSVDTYPYTTLAPAGANSPSDTYSDQVDFGDGSFFDVSRIWVDGSHSGDVVNYSFSAKI
jgi:hypothetical protein